MQDKLRRKAEEIWNQNNAEITLPHIDLSKPLDLIELERGSKGVVKKPYHRANVDAWSSSVAPRTMSELTRSFNLPSTDMPAVPIPVISVAGFGLEESE